jgi:hypothetical protein
MFLLFHNGIYPTLNISLRAKDYLLSNLLIINGNYPVVNETGAQKWGFSEIFRKTFPDLSGAGHCRSFLYRQKENPDEIMSKYKHLQLG